MRQPAGFPCHGNSSKGVRGLVRVGRGTGAKARSPPPRHAKARDACEDERKMRAPLSDTDKDTGRVRASPALLARPRAGGRWRLRARTSRMPARTQSCALTRARAQQAEGGGGGGGAQPRADGHGSRMTLRPGPPRPCRPGVGVTRTHTHTKPRTDIRIARTHLS